LHTPSELAQADVGWLYPLIKANVFDFPAGSKYALLFNNVGEQWKTHYESHSEADLGLCGYLARTLDNADDIDAAFRLRGLMRAKWDSAREDSTYGRDTIMKALKRRAIDNSPTDLGNARRLVAQHGQDLRFSHNWNKWLIWDGARFKVDETGEIERRAKKQFSRWNFNLLRNRTILAYFPDGRELRNQGAALRQWLVWPKPRKVYQLGPIFWMLILGC
jgi:hypothetical protein